MDVQLSKDLLALIKNNLSEINLEASDDEKLYSLLVNTSLPDKEGIYTKFLENNLLVKRNGDSYNLGLSIILRNNSILKDKSFIPNYFFDESIIPSSIPLNNDVKIFYSTAKVIQQINNSLGEYSILGSIMKSNELQKTSETKPFLVVQGLKNKDVVEYWQSLRMIRNNCDILQN